MRSTQARKARNGTGLVTPNRDVRVCEHNGLDLRDELSLGPFDILCHSEAFSLLKYVTLLPHGELPASDELLLHFRNEGRSSLSGITIPMENGEAYVVYNDSHTPERTRATLMEELFHLELGHPPTKVRPLVERSRTYNRSIESEAYNSGAAALVPYAGLRDMLKDGECISEIAAHFQVSVALVEFRSKVNLLYRKFPELMV